MEVDWTDIRQSSIKGTLKEFVDVLDGIFVPSSYIRLVGKDDRNGLLATPEKRKKDYRQAIVLESTRLLVYGTLGAAFYKLFN